MKRIFALVYCWSLCSLATVLPAIGQSLKPNFSVNTHTGRGSAVVNLGNVTAGDIVVPVNLLYDAGGVQVNDDGLATRLIESGYGRSYHSYQERISGQASAFPIAVNWVVSTGGMISREVKGLPDDHRGGTVDKRRGWLHHSYAQAIHNFTSTSDNNLAVGTDESTDYSTLNFYGDSIDTEPDIFTFNFDGYSGKFVFDHSPETGMTIRKIHTIPYQPFQVSYTLDLSNRIERFSIRTSNGRIYTFYATGWVTKSLTNDSGGDVLLSENYLATEIGRYKASITFNNEWGLAKIEDPKSGHSVDISYVTSSTSNHKRPFNVVQNNGNKTLFVENITKTISVPSSITGLNSSADIRESSVKFKQGNTQIKEVLFVKRKISDRTFLDKIVEGNGCLTMPPLQFQYFATQLLPKPTSFDYDIWGYYNASGATAAETDPESMLKHPQLYVYMSQTGINRYRHIPIPNVTSDVILNGAEQHANPDVVAIGTLNKIVLSGGGSIEITYESNRYYDQLAGEEVAGNGIRVKKVVTKDGVTNNDIIKEYEYGLNSGRLVTMPAFAIPIPVYERLGDPSQPKIYPHEKTGEELIRYFTLRTSHDLSAASFNDNSVQYGQVTEKFRGNGKIVYTYTGPATTGETTADIGLAPYNFNATISKLARSSTPAIPAHGIIVNDHFSFPYPESTSYDFERGLLTNQSVYNESGVLVKEVQYSYQRLNRGTQPYVIGGLSLESHLVNNVPVYFFGKYNLLTDVGKAISTEKTIVTNQNKNLASQIDYFYEAPAHRHLSRTRTTNSNGTVLQTKIKYPADFSASNNGTDASRALHYMKEYNDASHVEKVSTIIKPGEPEKVIAATVTKYADQTMSTNPSIHFSYPKHQYSLALNYPITDFTDTYLTGSGSSMDVGIDTRYKLMGTTLDWQKGLSVETVDKSNIKRAVLLDSKSRKIADIVNAGKNEVVLGNFSGTYSTSVSGRTPNAAYTLSANVPLTRTALIKDPATKDYYFSCWIKSASSGTLTVALTDGANFGNVSISYSNTSGEWRFYKSLVNASGLSSTLSITVQASTSCTIDYDILLYPTHSTVSYSSYTDIGKKSDHNYNGNVSFYEYDLLGRPVIIRDENNNIINMYTYSYQENAVLKAMFAMSGEYKVTHAVQFQAVENCYPNVTYSWSFGDGTYSSSSAMNSSHVYSTPGEYTVTLTVTHPNYATAVYSSQIIIYRDLDAYICTTGAIQYSAFNNHPPVYQDGDCALPHDATVGKNTFTVYFEHSLPPGAVVTYLWKKRINYMGWGASTTLTSTSNSQTIYVDPDYLYDYNSYDAECYVTISNVDWVSPNQTSFVLRLPIQFTDNIYNN